MASEKCVAFDIVSGTQVNNNNIYSRNTTFSFAKDRFNLIWYAERVDSGITPLEFRSAHAL